MLAGIVMERLFLPIVFKVNLKQRGYTQGDLEGAIISVAATDDNKTNVEVSEESRKKGIIINVVDDLQLSDFIIKFDTHI